MYTPDETVKRMQQIVFDILCDIDKFCRENNIKYYLSGGTCLGAVRHHGFIPWDDDGDVMMPREDYERFIKEYDKVKDAKYRIMTLDNEERCNLPYARVWDPNSVIIHKTIFAPKIGVSVDVFPIDGVSEFKTFRKFYYWKLKVLDTFCSEAIRKKYSNKHRFIMARKIVGKVAKHIGAHTFASMMNSYAKRRSFNKSRYVACSLPVHYGERETIDKKCFSESVYMDFRDVKFPVPIGYDTYLSNLYGKDYMKIPDGPRNGQHIDVWEVVFK